jgi:hypothetical protein
MTIRKEHIIKEIVRTAKENNGIPLGRVRFTSETGIKIYDWYGKYWANWSDALKEAGYGPNSYQQSYGEELVIQKLIEFIREIRKFPADGDLRLKRSNDKTFPNHSTFQRLLGKKPERIEKVISYCEKQGQLSDVLEICRPILNSGKDMSESEIDLERDVEVFGFVCLMKSGKDYKIGRSNSTGRRKYELDIQLPEKAHLIHEISTDDPAGIESYWHKRFEDKRKNGEWFELTASDVKAFKRRKFM